MLEVCELSVVRDDFRMEDITLRIKSGQCHAVLGPSGAGKTTLLQALLGVVSLHTGRVYVANTDVTNWPIEERGFGYVPQQLGLFPHLTVWENLLYGVKARGIALRKVQPLLDQLIHTTGLEPLLERMPASLSGGERQRVSLCRALVTQPRVVLLDEPFTALNQGLRRELWWLLRTLQREYALTLLLVTHDLTEAYVLADHVSVLWQGRIVQQGSPHAVYNRPAHEDVAWFLGVETLQPGKVLACEDGLAQVQVGPCVLTAVTERVVSGDVLVSIRGEDVLVWRDGGAPISARNVLPAKVTAVRPGMPLWSIALDVGFPLTALVTRAACEELELAPGRSVMAAVKAAHVHVIPRSV